MLGTGHDKADELPEYSYRRLTRVAFDTFGRSTSLDYPGRNEGLLLARKSRHQRTPRVACGEKRKWGSHKRESTDAGHRGGSARNSDEGP
jgi:hypothetical protein